MGGRRPLRLLPGSPSWLREFRAKKEEHLDMLQVRFTRASMGRHPVEHGTLHHLEEAEPEQPMEEGASIGNLSAL